jgi:hypothetical protein
VAAHAALDRDRRLERGGGKPERGEQLVAAGVDLVAAGSLHGRPKETAQLVQERTVPVAEAVDEIGRGLDIGQHEGDLTARQPELRPELAPDESEGHDPVLLGRLQEAHPRSVATRVVLEADATEPGKGVADVGLVVDREDPPTLGVDVGEGPVRQACTFLRAERWHVPMIGRSSRTRCAIVTRSGGGGRRS